MANGIHEISPERVAFGFDEGEAIAMSAVAMIDGALSSILQRELIGSSEVTDVLLDLRCLLTRSAEPVAGMVNPAEVVGSTALVLAQTGA